MAEASILEKEPDVAEVNRSSWKLIVTLVVPAITIGAAAYLFIIGSMIWCGVLVVLFLNLFALQSIFLKTSSQVWLGLFLSVLGLILPFYSVNLTYLVISALFVLLFFSAGVFSARHELNNMLKISFSSVARKAMVGGLTGIGGGIVILAISGTLGIPSLSYSSMAVYIDSYIVTPTMQYVVQQPYSPGETVRAFFASEAKTALSGIPGFNAQPTSYKNQLIAQQASSSVALIDGKFGISLNPDASISANILQVIVDKMNSLGQPAQFLAILGLYIILWSAVRLVAVILSYPLLITGFLIFEILILTNFAEMQMESRAHEIIVLK